MSRLPLMICDRRFDGTPSFAASLRADMSSSFSSSSRISPGWIGVRAILFLLLLVVIDNLDVLRFVRHPLFGGGSGDDGRLSLLLACRPDGDLNVLPQGSEEVHEALDGKAAGAVAHQCGDVGLLDAENLSGCSLGKAALLDEAVNFESQPCFQEFLLRMGDAEVGEDIPAAFF